MPFAHLRVFAACCCCCFRHFAVGNGKDTSRPHSVGTQCTDKARTKANCTFGWHWHLCLLTIVVAEGVGQSHFVVAIECARRRMADKRWLGDKRPKARRKSWKQSLGRAELTGTVVVAEINLLKFVEPGR